jgi:AcrR family transcriptional regulator
MEARIVAAAVDLFVTRGIDATSLQMIAGALGVTKGAVYYHFKTKQEIVLAVCADSFDQLDAVVVEAETID